MTWVLAIGAGWLLLAVVFAVLIGRSVRLADARAAADATHDEPNFVVDPAAAPNSLPSATVLPFPAVTVDGDKASPPPQRAVRDTPTVPGIPVARPPAPGATDPGTKADPVRKTGLA